MRWRIPLSMVFVVLLGYGCAKSGPVSTLPFSTKSAISPSPNAPTVERQITSSPVSPPIHPQVEPTQTSLPTATIVYAQRLAAIFETHFQENDKSFWIDQKGNIIKEEPWKKGFFWVTNPCQLYAHYMQVDKGFGLYTYDIFGNITQDIPVNFDLEQGDKTVDNISIAPDGKWLSYSIWSGFQTLSNAEFRDVEISEFDGKQLTSPVKLTRRGGAPLFGPAWSPDGKYFAYSDYDERGIVQIYLFDLKQKRIQPMTAFTAAEAKNYIVVAIKWTSLSDRIVYALGNKDKDVTDGKLGEVTILTRKNTIFSPVSSDWLGYDYFWLDTQNTEVLGWYSITQGSTQSSVDTFLWINLDTGQVTHSFERTRLPFDTVLYAFPLENLDTIAIGGSDGSFNIYDRQTDKIESKLLADEINAMMIDRIIYPPFGSIDKNQCQ